MGEDFDAFYTATATRLVGQLYLMTGDLAEAQDCVQEAFVRALQRPRTFAELASPEAWIRTVAWRIAVSRWRRSTTALRAHRRLASVAAVAGPDIAHVALVDALRRINAEQCRAVVLHHLCDLSVAEIAAETEAPVGTVKVRLARGRAALAELLQDDPDFRGSGPYAREANHG